MHWIDRAENRFGNLAIPGILRYVAIFNALSFVMIKLNPHFVQFLYLNRDLVMAGQVWRLVTYMFIPSMGGFFPDWLGAAMYIYYLIWIGDGLEDAMGAFRLTFFYLLGMLGTTVAAFIMGDDSSGFLLNTSLLFAFARFYPDVQIYILYILPMKVKWMAWLALAWLVLTFVGGNWAYRGAAIVALANYFIFFGGEMVRDVQQRQDVSQRRRRFEKAAAPEENALHKCVVCGRTENETDLEFRVAKDGQEYCSEHLPKTPPALN